MKRASDPSERTAVGRYELLFELATGGMGRVFVARQLGDAGFERIVALKRVHPHLVSDPDVYGMASDEARLSALLHHPNVVPVIDVVDARGELVLVMEYIEGVSLASLLRASRASSTDSTEPPSTRSGVDAAIASRVVLDALRGLAAAHTAHDLMGEPLDLVHRDVSPQNLLVGADGTTRVIDFGIARAEGRLTLTKTGVIKGKVLYMAPERLEEGEVDKRADIFSVGAVLYELIIGSWAFGAGDEAQQMTRILLGEIDFSTLRERAPKLAPVIERALARSPRDRFESAEAFAQALVLAEPPAEPEAVGAFVRSLKAEELASRRARIGEEVSRRLVEGAEPHQTSGSASGPKALVDAARSPLESVDALSSKASVVAPRPRSPSWLVGLGVGALLVNTIGWYALTRTSSGAGREAQAAAAQSDVPAAVSTPLPASATAVAAVAASTGGASVASAVPFTTPTGTRPAGLEPSPYGTGLRRSPYKRP